MHTSMTIHTPLAVPTALKRPTTIILPPTSNTPSFFIDNSKISYRHQYSNIYFIRLRKLRNVVEQNAHRKWRSVQGNPVLVEKVLEVVKGKLCYIVGTVYMDMPLKPNIIEDVARDRTIPPPPPPKKIFSPDDNIMLEDESGRISLVGEEIKGAKLVTGVIIAALGMETSAGDFNVIDYCFAEMAPQESEDTDDEMDIDDGGNGPSDLQDPWVAVVSGLDVGSISPSDAQIQMLVEYLTGEGGVVDDQVSASQVSRLIIAGDSLSSSAKELEPASAAEERKSRRHAQETTTLSSPHPILSLSSVLQDVADVMPIHILPGESDPSGVILPQQPFPPAMFGDAARYSTFTCETNPTYLTLSSEHRSSKSMKSPVKRTLLINSGQPLNDIFKYLSTPPNTRLSMLENTLKWRHMAPTAPDTLWCHPYRDDDPFILRQTPDIYIVGGQKRFGTRLITERSADAKAKGRSGAKCRVILIPGFASTGVLVLVNLRTLAVKRVKFSVHGMKAGSDAEVVQGEHLKELSPAPAEPISSAPKSSMDYE